MRLLHIFHDDREARTFSSYLIQEGIENQLDIAKNTDWGSDAYGTLACHLWIVDEDDVEAAHQHLEFFLENPRDKRFHYLRAPLLGHVAEETAPPAPVMVEPPQRKPSRKNKRSSPFTRTQMGIVTFLLVALCTALFSVSVMTRRPFERFPAMLPPTPLFSSAIEKTLYFDWPKAYEIIDQIIATFGFQELLNPQLLPPDGKAMILQYEKTPYWKGIYPKIIAFFENPQEFADWQQTPLFEKAAEGQIWRFLSPCFLHADILHLFFNMAWLLMIGKQMETRLGAPRYLLFIAIAGIFSNTLQYVMSGSNFIGFSGVLCGMIVFVWTRQKKAPWEGYHLLPSTMKFITGFILILAFVQAVFFFLEIFKVSEFRLPIANTAHLSGALAGYLMAHGKFFSWKSSRL